MDAIDRLQLLVLESDPAWAARLVDHLEDGGGWQVDVAPDTIRAVAMADSKDYDAVVLGPTRLLAAGALSATRRALPALPVVCVNSLATRARLERQLAAHRDEVGTMASNADSALFHLRLWPRLGLTWVNDRASEVFGLPREELLGRGASLFDAVVPEDMPALEHALQEAVGTPSNVRVRIHVAGEPETRCIDISLQPVPGDVEEGVTLLGVAEPADNELRIPTLELEERVATAGGVERQASPADVPHDLEGLARWVVANTDLGDRKVTFDGEHVDLEVDRTLVRDALAGVLDNVRRHTPVGTSVHVTVAAAMAGALLTVVDDGPGMRWPGGCAVGRYGMADVGSLAGSGGHGLGLLAKVASAHGGRATIQAAPGKGTAVRVLLHARVAPSSSPAPGAVTTPATVGG